MYRGNFLDWKSEKTKKCRNWVIIVCLNLQVAQGAVSRARISVHSIFSLIGLHRLSILKLQTDTDRLSYGEFSWSGRTHVHRQLDFHELGRKLQKGLFIRMLVGAVIWCEFSWEMYGWSLNIIDCYCCRCCRCCCSHCCYFLYHIVPSKNFLRQPWLDVYLWSKEA